MQTDRDILERQRQRQKDKQTQIDTQEDSGKV